MRFRSPMGLRILATTAAFAGLSAVALAANPAEAATLIFTGGTPTTFGAGTTPQTNSFTADGITATFSLPANNAGNAVSRSVNVGETTLPTGGTCLGGQRPTGIVCGNNSIANGPELNSVQITFNKDVILNSANITARTNVNDSGTLRAAISTWVNGATTRQFEYQAPTTGTEAQAFRLTDYTSQFDSFVVAANSPITVTSGMFGSIDYWLSSITVTENVPAPLPVVGGIAALGFARRLRSKVKLATK